MTSNRPNILQRFLRLMSRFKPRRSQDYTIIPFDTSAAQSQDLDLSEQLSRDLGALRDVIERLKALRDSEATVECLGASNSIMEESMPCSGAADRLRQTRGSSRREPNNSLLHEEVGSSGLPWEYTIAGPPPYSFRHREYQAPHEDRISDEEAIDGLAEATEALENNHPNYFVDPSPRCSSPDILHPAVPAYADGNAISGPIATVSSFNMDGASFLGDVEVNYVAGNQTVITTITHDSTQNSHNVLSFTTDNSFNTYVHTGR
ncbi:hypothetical protein HGRIS_005517 [Hohenbuehelia grisea]|uniref:Uncharacterized protein n=1 Tax=Hohenbuehelia grisea TaxID=104357 RepID=A0ABR3JZ58_9AGAR